MLVTRVWVETIQSMGEMFWLKNCLRSGGIHQSCCFDMGENIFYQREIWNFLMTARGKGLGERAIERKQ